MGRFNVQVESAARFNALKERAKKAALHIEHASEALKALTIIDTTEAALRARFGDLGALIEEDFEYAPEEE